MIIDVEIGLEICSNADCIAPRSNLLFTVGESIFIKTLFKDTIYGKYIEKVSAYFKGDGILVDSTDYLLTIKQSEEGYTIFELPLTVPSDNCLLQITVSITQQANVDGHVRRLAVSDEISRGIAQQVIVLRHFAVLSANPAVKQQQ